MSSSTGVKHKPALDESSFQQLLSAAYVVQQHNEEIRTKGPESGTSQVLASIAEIQSLVRSGNLNIAAAASLIANRLLALTRASGVSISLITDGFLDCVAEAGAAAKVPGSCVSSHSLVATERLKSGAMFESDNSQTDMRLDIGVCRSVGVGSLVAAPVHRFGEIAGLIEVRWNRAVAFEDCDLRTCRLIAGLMTGTLERSVRIGNARAALADEATARADVADQGSVEPAATGLERPASVSALQNAPQEPEAAVEPKLLAAAPQPATCRVCGRPLRADETFCGFCSMPRASANPSEGLQSKWASLWFMQRAKGVLQEVQAEEVEYSPTAAAQDLELTSGPEETPAETTPLAQVLRARTETEYSYTSTQTTTEHGTAVDETPFPFAEHPPIWERTTHFAELHRRDAMLLVVAIALAYGLISAWPNSNSQPTWFQALMVRVGASHAAAQHPVFAGNPDARVWLDVHTELYYCQGTDLYGKTPDGEFTTQHNAQSDGYQSASNATCP